LPFIVWSFRCAQTNKLPGLKKRSHLNPKKHFDTSFGVMTGAGDYEVVIELDPWLADVLRGRRLHRSQVWTDLPAGGCHLQLRLSCLEEIEQWVLSWGTRATVLRPNALAQRVAQTARELAERYSR
jgi:predicted DNA-binding transcriptional regulator YafY